MKVIVSGGGTGGHVYPAIAVANELKYRDAGVEILFVGALGKMEMEKVPQAGFHIEGLNIRGFKRKLSFENLQFPIRLISSLIRARSIITEFKPDVVVGFGGYASAPTVYVASNLGIPTVIQEQNSFPGISNKLLASRAQRVCVAYENMDRYFPEENIVLTGNPVRQDLLNVDDKRAEGLKYFGLSPDKKTLLLFGGSLGAKTLNQTMAEGADLISGRDDIQVLWQMGKLYSEEYSKSRTAGLDRVHALQFIDRMDLAYAAADVVASRAGALTISELCIAGKPVVLIPSPNVAEDHQTRNAMALVEREAAVAINDERSVAQTLPVAFEILDDAARRSLMSSRIRQLAKPEAAARIVDEIYDVLS